MSKTLDRDAQDAPRASRLIGAALVSVLLLGAAGLVAAQESVGDKLPIARTGLIDANQLFSGSLVGKRYSVKIEALEKAIQSAQQAKETEAARRSTGLAALKEELQKRADLLSPGERDNRVQAIRRAERDLQAFIEDGNSEIQRMQQHAQQETKNLQSEYQRQMRPHIEAVAREKGIDFLIDAAVALMLTSTHDISKDVIARADAAERAGGNKP